MKFMSPGTRFGKFGEVASLGSNASGTAYYVTLDESCSLCAEGVERAMRRVLESGFCNWLEDRKRCLFVLDCEEVAVAQMLEEAFLQFEAEEQLPPTFKPGAWKGRNRSPVAVC